MNGSKFSVFGIFTQIFNLLDKGLDQLQKYGLELKDKKVKELEDGRQQLLMKYFTGDNDDEIIVQLIAAKGSKVVDIQIVDKHNHKFEKQGVPIDKWEKLIEDFCIKYYNTDSFVRDDDDLSSSIKLQFEAKKITANKEISPKVHKIVCSGIPGDIALDMIDTVLDSDEFMDDLSSEPSIFEITDKGDSLDVNAIESNIGDIDLHFIFSDLLSSLYMINKQASENRWKSYLERKSDHVKAIDIVDKSKHSIDELIQAYIDCLKCIPDVSTELDERLCNNTLQDNICIFVDKLICHENQVFGIVVSGYDLYDNNFSYDLRTLLINMELEWNHSV